MKSRKIGALWLRKSKEGKTYMSGIIEDLSGDIQIAVFKNDKKEKDNQPDYQIVLSSKDDFKSKDAEDDFFNQEPAQPSEDVINYDEEEINPDDIPFGDSDPNEPM